LFERIPWPGVDLPQLRVLEKRKVGIRKKSSFIRRASLSQFVREIQDLPLSALHFATGIEVENFHGSSTALNVEESKPARKPARRQDGGPTKSRLKGGCST
jgi:hypothetical protein